MFFFGSTLTNSGIAQLKIKKKNNFKTYNEYSLDPIRDSNWNPKSKHPEWEIQTPKPHFGSRHNLDLNKTRLKFRPKETLS